MVLTSLEKGVSIHPQFDDFMVYISKNDHMD